MTKRGGTTVMVGVVPRGEEISLPGFDVVLGEKRILGSLMGSNAFRLAMPRYVDFYLKGQLLLDEIISARRPLEEINLCFDEFAPWSRCTQRDRLRVTDEPGLARRARRASGVCLQDPGKMPFTQMM